MAATSDSLAIIASLIDKLIDIQSGASSSKGVSSASATQSDSPTNSPTRDLDQKWINLRPKSAGPGDRPLTKAEQAVEKANWEAYYNAMDQDVSQNLTPIALEFVREVYGDEPSFQQAMKNGTVTVQRGEDVGWTVSGGERNIVYDSDGYYSGTTGRTGEYSGYENLAVWKDGKTYSATDASVRVARIQINKYPAYVTWPDHSVAA